MLSGLRRAATPLLFYSVGLLLCGALISVRYGLFRDSFDLTLVPRGDNTFALGYIKSFIEGYGFRYTDALGYPGVQDNYLHPQFEFSYRLFLWLVARWIKDPFTVYAVMYVAGVAAMFIATAAALQNLRIRLELAILGAIVFVVSPYFFSRAFVHDFLALYYSVPLGAALALLTTDVQARSDIGRMLREPFIAIAIVVCATSGIYYAFFTCMFLAFAAAVASVARRNWSPLLFALTASFVMIVLTAVSGIGIGGIVDALTGSIQRVRRFPTEQIMYGLRMSDVAGVIGSIPGLTKYINEYRNLVGPTSGRFEFPGPMLTAIILASPLLLATLGVWQPAAGEDDDRRRRRTIILTASACIVFGIFYAVPGGIGYVFGVFVFAAIRETQRIIPFLSFFALVILLTFAEMVLRSSARRAARCGIGALLILLVAGMLPTLLSRRHPPTLVQTPEIKASVASIRDLLRVKDVHGVTTVLQLPHVAWPEQHTIRAFDPYDHFMGFLYDTHQSKTRWSYGSTLSQPAFRTLKSVVDDHREAGLVAAAAKLGFDAILIEKPAYDAGELASLRANIERDVAPACRIYEDALRILYLIARQAGGQACLIRP